MPTEDVHIAAANQNQAALEALLPRLSEFSNWITTIAFYKALHVVEAAFANDPGIRHGLDHHSREQHLKTNNKYKNVYRNYRPLYSASIVARYLGDHARFADYMSPERVRDQILSHYLHQVEQSARKFLTNPGSLVSIKKVLGGPSA